MQIEIKAFSINGKEIKLDERACEPLDTIIIEEFMYRNEDRYLHKKHQVTVSELIELLEAVHE